MRASLAVLSAAVFLFASSAAKAEGECNTYKPGYDQTYCFSKLFVESDSELNSVYKELKEFLKGDVKQKLTEAQRSWIKYRDDSCSSGSTIRVDCNYDVNRARTEYLRDRLRECKTGTCRNDMIAKETWN